MPLRLIPALLLAVAVLCPALLLAEEPAAAEKETTTAEKKQDDKKFRELFDGKTLDGWKSSNFGGEGEVTVEDGHVSMVAGVVLTGIQYTGKDLPRTNYEVVWEARRTSGLDFFAAGTFPVKDSYCSFVPGGWAGAVVGLSNIDGRDASDNETTKYIAFKDDQWYTFKVRVTDDKIVCWIDDDKVVDVVITGKKITTRNEVDLSKPLGFSAFQSGADIRSIKLRELDKEELK